MDIEKVLQKQTKGKYIDMYLFRAIMIGIKDYVKTKRESVKLPFFMGIVYFRNNKVNLKLKKKYHEIKSIFT